MSRFEFLQALSRDCRLDDLRLIQKAYWLSKNVHRPQHRQSGERYFEHPVRVARMLIDLGYRDVNTVSTALLHDVVEDTYTPDHVIVDLFGPEVWDNINLLSKTRPALDPITLELIAEVKVDKDVYFDRIMKANKTVRLVKVADRVDNTSDLLSFTPERQEKYIKETEQYILPLAEMTDPALLSLLKSNLNINND